MSKVEIHHFTGETPIEKQHIHEMETLKVLHRLSQAMGREMNED